MHCYICGGYFTFAQGYGTCTCTSEDFARAAKRERHTPALNMDCSFCGINLAMVPGNERCPTRATIVLKAYRWHIKERKPDGPHHRHPMGRMSDEHLSALAQGTNPWDEDDVIPQEFREMARALLSP